MDNAKLAFGRGGIKNPHKIERCVYIKKNGLSNSEISKMEEMYGSNVLSEKKKIGFFRQLLSSFNDPIIKILLASLVINAIISLGRVNVAETVGIAAAILIATLVSTISEYSSSLAFEKLRSSDEALCTVRRDGKENDISYDKIVVGDIVIIRKGMSIPADGVLVAGEVFCEQATLTGEGVPKCKKTVQGGFFTPESMSWSPHSETQVFKGSTVCRGEGEMLVLRVGDTTFMGEVAGSLQQNSRPSPLKYRLSKLAHSISYLGYIGAAMIAFAYLFNSFFIDSGMNISLAVEKMKDIPYLLSEMLRAVTVAVSVIVVAVPEGLPMMITVVLSSNTKRMLKSGVLVRKLVGIETAGNMNILFCDKTGTLTQGKMKVCSMEGVGWMLETKQVKIRNMVDSCIINACTSKGSPTEIALCKFVKNKKSDAVSRMPFDSDIKLSAGLDSQGKSYFVGSPEKLLSFSKYYYDANGNICPMSEGDRNYVKNQISALGEKTFRVICLAVGNRQSYESIMNKNDGELVFLSLAALRDPVRHDVPSSVSTAHSAGIHVVMITGDNAATAAAIAKECGVLCKKYSTVLEAEMLHKMSDKEVLEILPELAVVSRALPGDKLRLVELSQRAGLVAGMTGDGINDAPALRGADVGFAMGSGTDVAKEAGDVVITDDSFSSITRAVLYGRTIFESIRKFVVFQLMMNLSAMGVSLIGPFIGIDSPVTVIQMLWVNIIMDTLGGLAFAGEPALREYMKRGSLDRNEKILSGAMLNQIIITGLYTLTLSIIFLKNRWLREYIGGSDIYYLTVFFAMFIFCGIFNSFNARTPSVRIFRHLSLNKPFILIMTVVAVVQLLIIYFGGEVFRCVPIAREHLVIAALIAFTVIPADMVRKLVMRNKHKKI